MIGSYSPVKVGLVTFAQPTFDVEWAEGIRIQTKTMLEHLGAEVVTWDKPLMYEAEAYEFRDLIRTAMVDVVVLQSGGFSFGGLPMIIATGVDMPCVIWSTPEPEFDGGPIRSNSLCAGIMNNAHLKHAGVKTEFIYGAPGPETEDTIRAMLRALQAMKVLRRAKIGVVGHRAPGFYSSGFDEVRLQADLGIEAFHIDLSTVLKTMVSISDEEADETIHEIDASIAEPVLEKRSGLRKSVKVYLALKSVAQEHHLDALAIKCWPEFPQEQGFSVCLSISLLNNAGIIAACEADVYGAVSMLIQDLLGDGPEFFNDLIHIETEENRGVYWHCGAAPMLLADEEAEKVIRLHGMRKTAASISFPLKPGRVTIMRLQHGKEHWRMFVTGGEAMKTSQLLQGNPSWVTFDAPVQGILDSIIENGFAHHYSTIYGDIRPELAWLCHFMDIELVQVC